MRRWRRRLTHRPELAPACPQSGVYVGNYSDGSPVLLVLMLDECAELMCGKSSPPPTIDDCWRQIRYRDNLRRGEL